MSKKTNIKVNLEKYEPKKETKKDIPEPEKEEKFKKTNVRVKIDNEIKKGIIDKIESWIKNSKLKNLVINKSLKFNESEDKLKKIIGEMLRCEEFQPNDIILKNNECGLINNENINLLKTVIVRNYSNFSLFISFLELINYGKDYNKEDEIDKVKPKLKAVGISDKVIDNFFKLDHIKEKIELEDFEKLNNILLDEYGYNIVIFFNNYYDLPPLISKIKSGKELVGLGINNGYIEKCSFIDLTNKSYSPKFSTNDSELQEKIKELSTEIPLPIRPLKSESKVRIGKPKDPDDLYATIDENDIDKDLSVIKLKIDDKEYKFLFGLTGNLYTMTVKPPKVISKDGSVGNELIGKIIDSDLYLVENYKELL